MFKPGEEVTSGDASRNPPVSMGRLLRRPSQVLHSGACGRTRDSGHKLKREIQTAYAERHFPHEDGQAVEQRPREAVQSPSLEVFKAQLIKSLGKLGHS